MHREIRSLLPKAKGESRSVLAVNLDVRDFSKFSLEVDSVETALYIRKLYQEILDKFYSEPSFFKPTGDGLLLVFDVDEGDIDSLTDISRMVVKGSVELVQSFSTLLDNDDWIYFPMPKRVGIGIARGAACQLTADGMTIDYSGTVLNIASRLMDIARPEGVVLDQTFPINLLPSSMQNTFMADENVILRSVAEEFPRKVYYRKGWTEISAANRRPLDEIDWKEKTATLTFAEFCERGPSFSIKLEADPIDPEQIFIELEYPTKAPRKGQPAPVQWNFHPGRDKWSYRSDAGRPKIRLDIEAIAQRMKEDGIKRTWPVTYRIRYPT
jgi:class 3 adenylate cyclase